MRPASWLDTLLHRFQDRWETNAQYRAAASGVLGLVVLITLCSCTGLLSVAASGALSSLGFGVGSTNASQGGGNLNTGTNQITGYKTFAVPTPPTVNSSGIPAASPIPNSQTPAPIPTPTPTPTAAPTATPCQTGCGGGGGGGGVVTTASPSPLTWASGAGQQNYIRVHSTKPNIGFGFIINTPTGGSLLYEPAGATDGNGDALWLFPQQCSPGKYHFTVKAQYSPDGGFDVLCA